MCAGRVSHIVRNLSAAAHSSFTCCTLTSNIFRYFSHAEVFGRISEVAPNDRVRWCLETADDGPGTLLAVTNPASASITHDDLMGLLADSREEEGLNFGATNSYAGSGSYWVPVAALSPLGKEIRIFGFDDQFIRLNIRCDGNICLNLDNMGIDGFPAFLACDRDTMITVKHKINFTDFIDFNGWHSFTQRI